MERNERITWGGGLAFGGWAEDAQWLEPSYIGVRPSVWRRFSRWPEDPAAANTESTLQGGRGPGTGLKTWLRRCRECAFQVVMVRGRGMVFSDSYFR